MGIQYSGTDFLYSFENLVALNDICLKLYSTSLIIMYSSLKWCLDIYVNLANESKCIIPIVPITGYQIVILLFSLKYFSTDSKCIPMPNKV